GRKPSAARRRGRAFGKGAAGALALASLLMAGAEVRSTSTLEYMIAANGGFGWPNSAKSCFQSASPEMINYCSTNQTLIIPGRSDGLSKLVDVYLDSPHGAQITCSVLVFASDGSGTVRSVTDGLFGRYVISGFPISLGFQSTWHVECSLPQNTAVLGVAGRTA